MENNDDNDDKNLIIEKTKSEGRKQENDFGISIEEMTKAGVCFGHKTTKIHPKMNPYLAGIKNTIHLIDLEKTAENLKTALNFIREIISQGKILLFVGTKIPIKKITQECAQDCGLPYVTERWLGGTFTNFPTIKKRIDYWKDLEAKKEKGELEKYTKKEKAKINQELTKFQIKFQGIKNLETLPEAIFVVDMRENKLAIKEAKRKGVKVIAIADTNVDPTLADYPIPGNDDAISAVKYILEKVKEVILSAKQK